MSGIFSRYVEKETFFQRVMKFLKKNQFFIGCIVLIGFINFGYFFNIINIDTLVNSLLGEWVYFLLISPVFLFVYGLFKFDIQSRIVFKIGAFLSIAVTVLLIFCYFEYNFIFEEIIKYLLINIIVIYGLILYVKKYYSSYCENNIKEKYAKGIIITYIISIVLVVGNYYL